ncbi:MAG: glycosyltransferase [Terriglobia bacterium]
MTNLTLPERHASAIPSSERPPVFLMTNTLETGGSERQFLTISRALDRERFSVELGCLKRKGALLEELEEIAEFNLGGSLYGWTSLRARMALLRHLRAHGVAVAHSFDFYTNVVLIPVARMAGVSAVIGSHRQIGDLLSPLQFAVQSAVFRLCDRVVCNSLAAAESLRDAGISQHKLVLISNALPADAFAETPPALPRLPGVLRVGMIARMNSPVKNHPLFLRAAARLATAFPTLEFVLVGDGLLRRSLERLAEQCGLGGRVRFLGNRRDIPAVLAALDVSVVPSFSESLSNAILESMAAGVPVVATRVGGSPEVVRHGETGLLVPADDEDALVEAIEELVTQPELRRKCGRQARELASACFGFDQVRGQFEQLYRDVLAEKGWKPRRQSAARERSQNPSVPLRVAVVAASLRWVGGQSAQADLLLRHWQNDPEVEARFVPIDPALPRWLAWAGRIPFARTALRMPLYLRELWKAAGRADIFHVFSASYWSFLIAPVPAWLVGRLRGTKVLINYHSGEARDHIRRWRTALPVLRRVDGIAVPSAYLVDVFREFGLEARAVPNIVDAREFCYRRRKPLRPRLVCTRGFHPYYRVDLVVRAFAEVKKEFPEAVLWLAGKGKSEPAIRGLVEELKLTGVEFTGAVPYREIGRVYDRADIFINASWLDNLPLSILEAFAAGAAVVTTAPEGIRYLVQHERTGLLSEPGDWQALARNVVRLLRDPDLGLRLAEQAHEELQCYQWPAVREQWLDLYRTLAGPVRRGSLEPARRDSVLTVGEQ